MEFFTTATGFAAIENTSWLQLRERLLGTFRGEKHLAFQAVELLPVGRAWAGFHLNPWLPVAKSAHKVTAE